MTYPYLPYYKVSAGFRIWDNPAGLTRLEDTRNWRAALNHSGLAEAMIEMTDRHAYHGTIVAWCGWDHPVLLREGGASWRGPGGASRKSESPADS